MTQSTEVWAAVPGYEGLYEVSDLGRMRSLNRDGFVRDGKIWGRRRGKFLALQQHPDGHMITRLSRAGVASSVKVHRIVAAVFVPGFASELEVCHNDGNAANNVWTNLRWDTHAENNRDTVRHGHHAQSRKTHCKRGHEFTHANTYVMRGGGRSCRECGRMHSREHQRARRAVRRTE